MQRHALTRSGASVVLSVALAGTLVPLFPGAAYAADDPAAEVVVPAPIRYQPRADTVLEAGADGFLHQQEGTTGTLWTDHATGATTPLTATGSGYGGMRATLDPETPGAPRTVSITALGSTGVRKVEVPEGASWTQGFTADSVLVSRSAADGSLTGLGIVRMQDGKAVERPVTGVPEGLVLRKGDAAYHRTTKGAVLFLTAPGGTAGKEYLVDYATAELRGMPDPADVDVIHFGDRHLLDGNGGAAPNEIRTVPRENPLATPVVTQLPKPPNGYKTSPVWPTVIGDWIVFGWSPESWVTKLPGVQMHAIPVGGGQPRFLLAHSAAQPRVAPDGSLLVTGGTSATDWAVRRISLGADGAPRIAKVKDVPPASATVDGLTLGAGALHYQATSDVSPYPGLYEHLLSITGTPTADKRIRVRGMPSSVDALVPLGNGEAAHQTGSDVIGGIEGQHADGMYGRLTGGSGRYVVSGTADTQYVGDLKRQFSTRRFDGKAASTIWGTTFWTSDPGAPSTISWYDVKTKAASPALAIGSGCTPNQLQAVGRWIHWSCAQGAKAGVWDQKTRVSTPVPFGETQLGDGFLVRKDKAAGKLTLTDFHTGDPAAVTTTDFASVPADADWSVDKFGGHVAFTDAEERIHIKPVTVPRSPIGVIEERLDTAVLNVANGGDSGWYGSWQLSRPAVRATIEIKNPAGATVATHIQTSREGAEFTLAWDGRGADGAFVPAAHYTWTLHADPGDGSGPRAVRTGTIQVADVYLPFRGYDGDGIGELFSLNGDTMRAHEPVKGTSTTSSGWTGVNHVVPFGDLDNDGCNDVLTRTTTGDLYRHSAKCAGVPTPTSPKAKIGAGFSTFDALLNSGDMTGDGRPDLLARQRSTGDLYLYADNAAGGIKAGVKLAGKWNGLTLIGAGDLDRDGHPYLLARDAGGELWRYKSTGTGAFLARTLVFSDWGTGRDAIIGTGDVDGDHKYDLISRDTNGKLLRNSGDGKGSFGPTVQIGSGWGAYGSLY
ncbi:FG-GAP-like repeat-containing protein [Streptomyces sp. NPDC049837]|uniref:FG-GAP-like repeat-containing protein n=1 Tax=Streptomyces sp. NPDC049837 TaxID=3155277 RepID=UPI003443E32C